MEKIKLVTFAWKKCCTKINEGGLGLISLKHYNTATNIHLCWEFLNTKQSWDALLTARVKRNNKLINYSIKSSLWKSFKEVYDTVMDNYVWIIGNGRKINFWLDNWAGESLAFKYKIQERFHPNLTMKIEDCWINNSWSLHDNIHLALSGLLTIISPYSVSEMDIEDSLAWKNVENRILTIKHAYNMITKPASKDGWSKFPWEKDTSPTHSIIIWRLLHNWIPNDENFTLRGFQFSSMFSLKLLSTYSLIALLL